LFVVGRCRAGGATPLRSLRPDSHKLIHQELQRNTAATLDARALATEVNAQIPLVQETNAVVERLYSLHGPASANGHATKGS
jgi:hypothetical protein